MEPSQDARLRALEHRLARERKARKEAERLLETKSREVYEANTQLRALTANLELQVEQRTNELREMRDQALRSSHFKSVFLAHMSHEIRTPISSVIGMAELLAASGLEPGSAERVNYILTAAHGLLSIVNDILDLSKLEAGKVELNPTDFDLCRLLSEITDLLGQSAREKHLDFRLAIDPGVPRWLRGDELRLRQILLNLSANAIKFTDRGAISIRVCSDTGTTQEEAPLLRFEVADSGIGISANGQRSLFRRFSQVDSSGQRGPSAGTGLGLNICKILAGLMNGDIGVISEPGKGSTFWFTAQLELASSPRPAQTLPNVRLLGIGLSPVIRDLVGGQLAYLGIAHEHFEDVEALARRLDEAELANLVLFDPIALPPTDQGRLEALSRRGRCRLLAIPPGPQASVTAAVSRQVQVLSWPLTHIEWTRVLTGEDRGKIGADTPSPAAAEGRRILLVEDTKALQLVAQAQLRKLGHRVRVASNGREALQCLAEERFDLVLMDIQMPELDGLEATRQIRASSDPRTALLPVVALTACAMKGDEHTFAEAGMNDYLVKPLDVARLKSVLQRWLATREPASSDMP